MTASEEQRTAIGTVPRFDENGEVRMPEIHGATKVRLVRANVLRLKKTNDAYHVYFYSDNSKDRNTNDLNYVEVEAGSVEIIKRLIRSYPEYIKVRDLSEDHDAAEAAAYSLWDRGVLMTKNPLHQ